MNKKDFKNQIRILASRKGLRVSVQPGAGADIIRVLNASRKLVATGTIKHNSLNAGRYDSRDANVTLREIGRLNASTLGVERLYKFYDVSPYNNSSSYALDPELVDEYGVDPVSILKVKNRYSGWVGDKGVLTLCSDGTLVYEVGGSLHSTSVKDVLFDIDQYGFYKEGGRLST